MGFGWRNHYVWLKNAYICVNIKTIANMKDPKEYCTLYHLGKKTLMAHKDECHYSIIL